WLHIFVADPPPPDLYTLSLHDALPIWFGRYELPVYARRIAAPCARLCRQGGRALRHHPRAMGGAREGGTQRGHEAVGTRRADGEDRKSTRLNSSHSQISYAVFCLKKKI